MPALDACAIVTAADAGALLSAPIENAQEVVSNADATRAVSQCVASTAGPRSVSVLISYSASDCNPTTKEEWIAAERDADLLGLGEEAAAALASAEELPGLGDLAVAYELFGQNVAVFWEGRYRMIVSVNGMPDRPAALEVARALARTAMDRH